MVDNPDIGTRVWSAFARMVEGAPVEIDNSPLRWLTDTWQRPTDEWLAEKGFYGYIETAPPAFDGKTHKAGRDPLAALAVDHEQHIVTQTWTITPLSPAELAMVRQAEERAIDAERDRRIHGGMIFAGKLFQTRVEDQKRIAGAGTLALAAMVQGVEPGDLRWHGGTSDFEWIAADNSVMAMDAQTVFGFGQRAATWERDHIFAARTLKSMEVIPADFVDDSYWPALS